MPATLARIEANRRNALKSTGPKTPAGKARSRENGLKHGLTGEGVVMSDENRSAVDARKARLLEQLCPSTELGGILVDRIAVLSVRLEQSVRVEQVDTSRRVREAPTAFDDAREREEHRLGHAIKGQGIWEGGSTPGIVFRKLCRTSGGVGRLIRNWKWLRDSVEKSRPGAGYGQPFATIDAEQFDYLDGRVPDRVSPSEPYAAALRLNAGDASMKPVLYGFIDEAIARLEALRAAIDPAEAELDRSEAVELALFDPSKEGDLRRRYEARTEGALFRAIRELRIAERPAKDKVEEEAPADAEAEPQAAPKAPRPALTIADPDSPGYVDVSAAVEPAPTIPEATEEPATADEGPAEETFRQRRRREFAEYHAKLRAGEVPDYVPKWR